MQYKPAYVVVNKGDVKVFVGNYDNLADLRNDDEFKEYYETWEENNILFARLLTPKEFEERKKERRLRSSLFFYFLRRLKRAF